MIYFRKCPAKAISVPNTTAFAKIIGTDFLSVSAMIIMIGIAIISAISPPSIHQTTLGKSILIIITETNRYCKNAETIARFGNFLRIIGRASIAHTTMPISTESKITFIFFYFLIDNLLQI